MPIKTPKGFSITRNHVSVSELPEWEGNKVGIVCPCGGNLETITDDFSIEGGDRIGAKEIVRCVRCSQEFNQDDNERLKGGSLK